MDKKGYIEYRNIEDFKLSTIFGAMGRVIPSECRKIKTNEDLYNLINIAKNEKWKVFGVIDFPISRIPGELWELEDLEVLFLRNNEIENIPKEIIKLKKLKALSLAENKIKIIPDSFKQLQVLYLDLYHCGFEQIPDNIMCPTLKGIGIDITSKHLTDKILELKELEYLYMSGAQIVDLPDNIYQLQNLREIYLTKTKIQSLPNSIQKLKKIQLFNIHDTPLAENIPPEILERSDFSLTRYISLINSKANKYFNESKMLVVGQGRVGKTCVINRITKGIYEDEISTEGIDIHDWEYSIKKSSIDEKYRLNVWDFGGQEIYHATHQFFLTKRSLYLLVWDGQAEDEYGRIEYWLKTIESFANDSPVILVINKCDLTIGRIKKIDYPRYLSEFPQIAGIEHISCKDNVGIEDLRSKIQKNAIELPLMQTKWITTWLQVRFKIEELSKSKSFIQYEEYLKLCEENDVEESDALILINYLNDLGIVLYFSDNMLLSNLVILKPEWGTTAVYKVLDEQERLLKNRNGILTRDDLKKIWNIEDGYKQEMYPYLIEIMKKFELLFTIESDVYLVAELLNNIKYNINTNFNKEDAIVFRYQYDFAPAGIITRLIVLLSEFLMGINGERLCWQQGMYLQYNQSIGEIILYNSISEKYIEIRIVNGNSRNKTELLTIIRANIEKINKRYSKLKVTPKVPCNCKKCSPFLFDYSMLLKAEEKGRRTVMCNESVEDVSIEELLLGIENSNDTLEDLFYNGISIEDIKLKGITYEGLFEDIKKACIKLQGKSTIRLEDQRNDFLDNMLESAGYRTKDQTRFGFTELGNIGENDIQILNHDGIIFSIIEGMNLESINKSYMEKHWKKIFKYDAVGLKENFIVTYASVKDFNSFWVKYKQTLLECEFEYLIEKCDDIDVDFADMRILKARHIRNERDTYTTHIAIKMHI